MTNKPNPNKPTPPNKHVPAQESIKQRQPELGRVHSNDRTAETQVMRTRPTPPPPKK